MLWRSRALRVLVWLRYSDLFLPSPSLRVVTSIALSPRGSALFDLLVSRMYLVALSVDFTKFSHVMLFSGSESPGLAPLLYIFPFQVRFSLLSQALLSRSEVPFFSNYWFRAVLGRADRRPQVV